MHPKHLPFSHPSLPAPLPPALSLPLPPLAPRHLDTDGDGRVSLEELRLIMRELGVSSDDVDARQLMDMLQEQEQEQEAEAGKERRDGDGRSVSLARFLDFLQQVRKTGPGQGRAGLPKMPFWPCTLLQRCCPTPHLYHTAAPPLTCTTLLPHPSLALHCCPTPHLYYTAAPPLTCTTLLPHPSPVLHCCPTHHLYYSAAPTLTCTTLLPQPSPALHLYFTHKLSNGGTHCWGGTLRTAHAEPPFQHS